MSKMRGEGDGEASSAVGEAAAAGRAREAWPGQRRRDPETGLRRRPLLRAAFLSALLGTFGRLKKSAKAEKRRRPAGLAGGTRMSGKAARSAGAGPDRGTFGREAEGRAEEGGGRRCSGSGTTGSTAVNPRVRGRPPGSSARGRLALGDGRAGPSFARGTPLPLRPTRPAGPRRRPGLPARAFSSAGRPGSTGREEVPPQTSARRGRAAGAAGCHDDRCCGRPVTSAGGVKPRPAGG